jgi:CPA1 family monovalent cation:H+ antiporter
LEVFEATLALLGAALFLSAIAGRLAVPYPSLLVLGGLALGFLPLAQHIELDPELAFALFLPPILFEAAYYTSWRDFTANIRPIAGLAVILVGVTTWVVAVVADRLIPELPIGAAYVLGAIVSPPDAAAATAVLNRMRLPKRVVTIIEGESMVNDAVALVIYNFAVAAVVTGHFSAPRAGMALGGSVFGSVAIGLAIGWGWSKLAAKITDPLISVAASFLVAFATYLAGEQAHVSGVLTVVVTGLFFAWRSPYTISADIRLNSGAVWRLAIFVLNALAFVLIGLQLPQIVAELPQYSLLTLGEDASVIAGTVILVRLVWIMTLSQIIRWGSTKKESTLDWRESLVIGWSGMRGLISLAAALALPETVNGGTPFPARALIMFLSFAVILATLVIQGLSLGALIRLVKLKDDNGAEAEESLARAEAANAAIGVIDKLAETPALPRDVLDRVRLLYINRLAQLNEGGDPNPDSPSNADFADAVRLAAIAAERKAVLTLHRSRALGDETWRTIQRELDLAEYTLRTRRPSYSQATWLDLARRTKKGLEKAGA